MLFRSRVIETPDKANATYRAAMNLQLRDDHPDYVPLVVANYLIGGSSDSRLSRRIREQQGISYSVGSYLSASSFDAAGEFGVYAIYAPQNRLRLEALVREELQRAYAEGFSEAEVEAAKKGMLQARQVSRAQDRAIAGRLASHLVLGRTYAWDAQIDRRIASLTPREIADAMKRHMDLSQLSVVRAGDVSGAAPRAAAGPSN